MIDKLDENKPIVFRVPNQDTYINKHTLCPKEVLQKGYLDSIGTTIDYLGGNKKVISVDITDAYIYVVLE